MSSRRLVASALVLSALAGEAAPQAAAPARSTDSLAVAKLWRDYLATKAGEYSRRAGSPSTHWLASEQRKWRVYDLAEFYLPEGASPETITLDPEHLPDSLGGNAFRIKTRFNVGASASSFWTTTVYARRDGEEWRLANALPINTRTWRRTTVGPITYVYPPNYKFTKDRAELAIGFVDSVARTFRLPSLAPLTYYLAPTLDDLYRAIGVETGETYGPSGGFSQPVNHQLFSGIPSLGENYRHELAHMLFAPICCERTSYLISEGVPTWLGGTSGDDFEGAVAKLRVFLLAHPGVTLDSLLAGELHPSESYPAAAVLVQMVADRGGASGVRELYAAGSSSDQLRSDLEAVLGQSWQQINAAWREAILNRPGRRPSGMSRTR
jgi:hypothetical protein